jgi:chromate transporter
MATLSLPNYLKLFVRHIDFLKNVFYYACTAFGGPSAHIGMMQKYFVERRKDVTQEELIDIFSFCQLLPGPSSTQTVTLIGYKRGGWLLAITTLLIWILPAILIMSLLAILLNYFNTLSFNNNIFFIVQSMAIGFLCYASFVAMQSKVSNHATRLIMLIAIIVSCFYQSPWVLPILMVLAGFVTNLSDKRIQIAHTINRKVKWGNIYVFFILFGVSAILSETSRVQHWEYSKYFNLFENFYRMGSLTWGGGHALIPAMHSQFIELPIYRGLTPLISKQDFLTGCGLMNCVPGPVFSITSFMGSMMCKGSFFTQLGGGFLAGLAIFLPSLLLVFFLFPIYNNLKNNVVVFRALEGIHAVVIGIMWSGVLVLLNQEFQNETINYFWGKIITIGLTFLILKFTKIPPPIIIALGFVAGILLP